MTSPAFDPFEAFKNARSPDGNIVSHNCVECDEIYKDFSSYASRDVPDYVLERRADSLPLLTPAAWRYFLPAYLDYAIRHPNSEVGEYVLVHFECACDDPELYKGSNIEALRPSERDALRDFLQLLVPRDDDPINEATVNQIIAALDAT